MVEIRFVRKSSTVLARPVIYYSEEKWSQDCHGYNVEFTLCTVRKQIKHSLTFVLYTATGTLVDFDTFTVGC